MNNTEGNDDMVDLKNRGGEVDRGKLLLFLQNQLIQFLKESEMFRLKEAFHDSIIIYDKITMDELERQEKVYKNVRRVFREVKKKSKKTGVGIFSQNIQIDQELIELINEVVNKNEQYYLNAINAPASTNNDDSSYNLVKEDFEWIKGCDDFVFNDRTIHRNLSQSSTHAQYLNTTATASNTTSPNQNTASPASNITTSNNTTTNNNTTNIVTNSTNISADNNLGSNNTGETPNTSPSNNNQLNNQSDLQTSDLQNTTVSQLQKDEVTTVIGTAINQSVIIQNGDIAHVPTTSQFSINVLKSKKQSKDKSKSVSETGGGGSSNKEVNNKKKPNPGNDNASNSTTPDQPSRNLFFDA